MKKIFLLAPLCILLFSFHGKTDSTPVYTIVVMPLQDTLLPGMDNNLEILLGGQPADITAIAVNAKNLDYVYKGGALFIATCEASDQPQEAKIQLVRQGKILLEKQFVIPVMTPELKARAEAVIAAQAKNAK